MLEYAFFEGKIIPFTDAKVSIGTHALQYGTGAFAGIRGYLDADGETINIFRLPDHCARLLNSAKLLRMELPYDRASLGQVIIDLVKANAPTSDVYIRPFLYKPAVELTPRLRGIGDELAVYMLHLGNYLDTSGIDAIVSSWIRIPDHAAPSRGKLSGTYINSSFAKDEALQAGAAEAILLDAHGHVAEGSACNIFVVRDGVLITPPVTGDVLEGITRRTVFQFAKDAGIPTQERSIDRSELYIADEVFFCGTGVQVAPVARIDGRPIADSQPGAITRHLQEILFAAVRGERPEYASFLTQVPIAQPVATLAD